MSPRPLLREHLRALKPYEAGKPIEEVQRELGLEGRIAKLASNENPLGVSPRATEALHKAIDQVWLYPDDHAYCLRKRLAEKHRVGIECVLAASGSVELIDLTTSAFINPGDVVVTSEKTFAMYELSARKAGAEVRLAPMCEGGFRYDLQAMAKLIDNKTKLVLLANPTNPTGTWFTKAEFDAFMQKVPEDVLVVYDAAYQEYVTVEDMPHPLEYLRAGRRIAVFRTFSKAYGLAGIRIGYGLAPKDIVQGWMTCRTPFTTSLLAQVAALAALEDTEFVAQAKAFNTKEIAFLSEGLKDLPVQVPRSQTNFVYIQCQKDARWLFAELQKVGIIVRPVGPNAIRVSSGLRPDNEKFLEHFRRLILQ